MKNYAAAIPLVGDLRSPAMRPRHWEALMAATKASPMFYSGIPKTDTYVGIPGYLQLLFRKNAS
jgi:hypothetical protein